MVSFNGGEHMRKVLTFCLCMILFLSGCNVSKISDEQQKIYDGFKDSLLNNGELISNNIPFSYDIDVEEKDEKFVYTVFVNEPLVAMRNIQMMILNPDDLTKDIETGTIGIFDETLTHMIPNQENEKAGYLSEIRLQGVSSQKDFSVYAMIVWKDSNQLTQYQAFFSFKIVDGKNVKVG